ncbi:MAG: hypothetical protein IJ039_04985 [Clostridia bacterium]|nr:hypothetical protein [Clostridia bacterium]
MKIGEMKAQAITLMFPQASVKLDESSDEDVIRAIYEMKSNPNFESILEGSVGAINRAFSYIESRGLSTLKCVDIPSSTCEKRNGKIVLPSNDELLTVERVLLHSCDKAYAIGFETENGSILTEYRAGIYTVVYRTKIPRITRTTSDAYEPILPHGMAECIPYFIVSDLAREENEEMAKYALEHFEKTVQSIGEREAPCHECFQIVYKWD